MKAAVLRRRGELVVQEVSVPQPNDDEVLIRVKACGVCGSDIRYFRGDNPWSMQTLGEVHENPSNMVLGHELSGIVEACPSGHPTLQEGDRVSVLAYKGCGVCKYCRSDRENLCAQTEHLGHGAGWDDRAFCPGGMAEYCTAWSDKVFALPDSVSFEEAVFLDGVAVALHAFNRGSMRQGDRVVIVGCGPIGLVLLQIAKLSGASSVICVDVQSKPLELAALLGADKTVQVEPGALAESFRDAGVDEADVIFDSVGEASDLEPILSLLARGGTLVWLVVKDQRLAINHRLLAGERTLTVSANNRYEFFPQAVDLVAQKRVVVKPMITHRFALADINEGFAVMAEKERYDALKVVIFP